MRLTTLAILVGLLVLRPDRALRSATGMTAHILCSAVFISHLDPDTVFAQHVRTLIGPVAALIGHGVDRTAKRAHAAICGALPAEAQFAEGYGCRLVHAGDEALVPRAAAAQTSNDLLTSPSTNPDIATAIEQVTFRRRVRTPVVLSVALASFCIYQNVVFAPDRFNRHNSCNR